MNNRAVSGMLLTLLLISMLALAFNIQPVRAGGTIYIRADGSVDPPTAPIQRDGDIYTFNDNIYDEILVGRDNIVVDGAGYTLQGAGSGTGIKLSDRNNVTIKNMEIKKYDNGIFLLESFNNGIYGNNITDNDSIGIMLSGSSNNSISGNKMNGNRYNLKVMGEHSDFMNDIDVSNLVNGKPVYYLADQNDLVINPATFPEIGYLAVINSNNVTVEGLTLMNNYQGLLLAYTEDSKITYNNITNNYYGIFLRGCSNNTILHNNIRNNTNGIYLRRHPLSWREKCSNNTISRNNITNNFLGVEISASSYNDISNNKITNNVYSIYLFVSGKNTISHNNIVSNRAVGGIHLTGSSHNIIFDNNIINNDKYGIKLSEHSFFGASSNNNIFHNNFINNTDQVYVSGEHSNVWDNGYPPGGNYWDDYCELDPDGDGIGDKPYVIDANNQDRYPLVAPLGPIPIVWGETIYPAELKSNSTIYRFQFNASQRMMSFNVTGPDGTLGFCNLTIPNSLVEDLWQGNYIVLVDEEEPLTMNEWADGTYTYIYFTYVHSTHEVTIIQKIPPFWMQWWLWAIVAIVIVVSAGAIYLKRRRPTTPPPPSESVEQSE